VSRPRVVVTGMGLLTPTGIGLEENWENLRLGRSGIAPITRFDASRHQTRFAGEVKGFDPSRYMDRKQARRYGRSQQFALAAAQMAMEDAGLVVAAEHAHRASVIIGSCVGGLNDAETALEDAMRDRDPQAVTPFFILNVLPNMAASHVSIAHGLRGPSWGTNSACATSAHALGEGAELIRRGGADVVLAGGTESPIGFMCVAGFNAIRALSTRNEAPDQASRPFDADRDGFVLAEGAAVLVLESEAHARARGARIHAELAGYGSSSDAFHVTAPAPDHEGATRCMRRALEDAGLATEQVRYLNAHATSTPAGDVAEAHAIRAVFGAHTPQLLVSATKSMFGHLTGAGGAAEAIVSILAMNRDLAPPTINVDRLDPDVDLDCVPHVARVMEAEAVMSNSFGFGGTNATLVFRRAPQG